MQLSKKALFSLFVAAVLTVSSYAAFIKEQTYGDGQFKDVPADAWYASEVKSTFELGLMNGISNDMFDPSGNVTVAQAVTMAARAASTYAGDAIPAVDGEWYQMYLNYAISKGFVKEGQFDDLSRPAKRYEVAKLFEDAMPEGYYAAKNDVAAIPDISDTLPYYKDLLTLYRAGIVMGSDSYGNFKPEDNITRAEAAAIINRVALPENRLEKTLDKISADDAYLLTSVSGYGGANMIGMKTGWVLDNRGGVPFTTKNVSSGIVADISDDAGVAVIREFNKTETGVVVLEADYTLKDAPEGSYVEYINEAGETVYRLEVKDGAWQILGADGVYTKLTVAPVGEYVFKIIVDLDNGRSTTYINGYKWGTHPLAKTGTDIYNLRFGCTDKGMSTAGPGNVDMYVNYPVYNKFSFDIPDVAPEGWTGSGAVKNDILEIPASGNSSTMFSPVSGTVVAEADIYIDSKSKAEYCLNSGIKKVVSMSFDGKNVVVNGQNVYEYYDGLWYRFRFELDTVNMKVLVKINGREVATVPFVERATSVDSLSVVNLGAEILKSDNYKVFRLVEHSDYVPKPVKPSGEEKHTIGINVCSLWVEGTHSGWATVSPYEKLVLGYYDEGLPESADWEIKYMVEHGIDFQAFCWYADQSDAPLKTPRLVSQLHDGYMNAKYSDDMKYCLIWEAGNGAKPKNMDAFKKYYVPYFIENYFKDQRYMVIDNKPILCFFGANSLAGSSSLGSNAAVKEALDYLRNEVKKLGYEDLIIIGNTAQKTAGEFGFDGIYAYNWGNVGYRLDVNKERNLSTANGSPYTVPTISVGFNNIPWAGTRHPMMTGSDFLAAQEWVKSEYLSTYAKEDWQKNFVMISTWNEYGEGTFLMPGEQNGGFAYLDGLRQAYTDEKVDESLNTVPTDEQLRRINRMYPQYRRHLRDLGYSELVTEDKYDVAYTYDFTTVEDTSKLNPVHAVNLYVDNINGLTYTSDNWDSFVYCKFDGLDLEDIVAIRMTANIPQGVSGELFFITEQDGSWNQTKSVQIYNTTGEMSEYLITLKKTVWTGNLKSMRVDLMNKADHTGSIKKIEFLTNKKQPTNEFKINGLEFKGNTSNKILEDGTVLSAFDPSLALDFRLNTFYRWNKDKGILELNFKNKVLVYTVGSDKYTVNGVEKELGYKLYLEDGLPMLSLKKLCEDVGYTYEFKDGVTIIDTEHKEYFAGLANKDPGAFEFNTFGNTEGWSSGHFELSVGNDGVMKYNKISTTTDPITSFTFGKPLPTRNYNALKVRIKYELTSPYSRICMYFATDKDGSFNEAKAIAANIGKSSGGKFVEYTIDISKNVNWSGNVTKLRFDPFDGGGWCEVDYMRFYYDEKFDAPYDVKKNDPNTQYNPKFDKFEIVNWDAESTGGFVSRNANISIVTDPVNADNKCYLVVPKTDDKEVWVYADQSVRFNRGATYKVEADIKLASYGTNMTPEEDVKTTILCNAIYKEPDKSSVDHVVARFYNVTLSEGWRHVTFEFKVPMESTDRKDDMFSFFADPVNKKGLGFYFDNVKVTETRPAS